MRLDLGNDFRQDLHLKLICVPHHHPILPRRKIIEVWLVNRPINLVMKSDDVFLKTQVRYGCR